MNTNPIPYKLRLISRQFITNTVEVECDEVFVDKYTQFVFNAGRLGSYEVRYPQSPLHAILRSEGLPHLAEQLEEGSEGCFRHIDKGDLNLLFALTEEALAEVTPNDTELNGALQYIQARLAYAAQKVEA